MAFVNTKGADAFLFPSTALRQSEASMGQGRPRAWEKSKKRRKKEKQRDRRERDLASGVGKQDGESLGLLREGTGQVVVCQPDPKMSFCRPESTLG